MADLTPDTARALVEDIAHSHGYISPAIMASMPPEARRAVEMAMARKDDMIASSVFTLATNLYLSSSRFIFELLQNADDNSYNQANQAGEEPYVAFNVYHDKLVMECNEDGFNEANLRAICDIGKSSKQGAQGYIGEKGIGFKSTFMAAWKVEIQSGPLSFYFSHRKGDSGMGMVTPIWTEPTSQTPGSPTTTTLYFHDHDGPEALKARRDSIIEQLRNLTGEVLLFLQKLKNIKIASFDQDGRQLWSRLTKLRGGEAEGNDTAVAWLYSLETIRQRVLPAHVRRFYTVAHQAEGLAKNDNRTYTPEEEATNAYSNANVVVAFPIDDDGEPVVEPQELFAFMPLRKVGFNFLIHSDFVTQANRQDIVPASERNIGLRRAIATTFCKGLEKMCSHPGLRYTWMRYLPRHDNLPLDPFWRELVPLIERALLTPRLLFARDGPLENGFSIQQLRCLEGCHVDKDDKPLIPDLDSSRIYISDDYNSNDIGNLKRYGLRTLDGRDLMPRLKAFVETPAWRERLVAIFNRDEDWHSRMAKLLLNLWEGNGSLKSEMQHLPLLPRGMNVEKPSAGGIFFPDIDGIAVPIDLGFKLLHRMAAKNAECRKLYAKLGVTTTSREEVRESILKKHRKGILLNAYSSNSHLRFIYLSEEKGRSQPFDREGMLIFDQKERAKKPPRGEFVYFPGEGEDANTTILGYSAKAEPLTANGQGGEPDVSFLHSTYLMAPPETPKGQDRDFSEWLYDKYWVDKRVQIFTLRKPLTDEEKIFTKEWIYLAQHRPDLIVTRTCTNWESQSLIDLWISDKKGTSMMRELKMLCTNGKLQPLRETFAPLPSLVERCSLFLTDVEKMPFLQYPRIIGEADSGRMMGPAKLFGFGVADDLTLSLAILRCIIEGASATTRSVTECVVDLYLRIHAQCLASDSKDESEAQVRTLFQDHAGVLCTPSLDGPAEDGPCMHRWVPIDSCSLDAPPGFKLKEPIAEIFKPVAVALSSAHRETLEMFFRHTLQIKATTADDIMDELCILSGDAERTPLEAGYAQLLYRRLDDMRTALETDEDASKRLKGRLQKERCIYVPSDSDSGCWFTVSECIWSTNGAVLGKTCLESHYTDLEPFFVKFLGVRTLDLNLVMQDLVAVGNEDADVDYVKTLLLSLNTLLLGDARHSSGPAFTDEARAARVFPVRLPDGTIKTMAALDEFAINDRPSFAEALRGKVRFLDFSLAEVSQLQPLIQWAGLKERYLSHSVVESTVVDDDLCTVDGGMTLDLYRKAKAFASVSAHFRMHSALEPCDAATLYTRLRGIKAFFAERIASSFSLVQDGRRTTIPDVQNELHIAANPATNSWDVFLSADEDARDVGIASRLPRELGAILLGCKPWAVDPRAVSVLASIVHAKGKSVVRVLESSGIEVLAGLPSSDLGEDHGEDEVMAELVASRVNPASRGFSAQELASGHDYWGTTARDSDSSPDTVIAEAPRENAQYVRLLNQVVQEARGLLDFPARGEVLVAGTQSLYRFTAGEQQLWRRMCGCAGELFVFELLSHLRPALANFGLANWQSTVRGFASAHAEYSTIQPWNRSEESDVCYKDVSGILTSLLVDKGYLDSGRWAGRTPEYHIEVKTTMKGDVEAPFYVSKWQYMRMQSMSQWPEGQKLYVLFRVYGLESGRIGFRLFVDPEDARRRGLLQFEAEGWTVTAKR